MRIITGLAALALLSSAASAASLDDLQAAQARLYEAWETVPLTMRVSTLVEEESAGFGVYRTRASKIFKAGEPIVLYVEPIGYGWKPMDDGTFEIGFVADLAIKDESGKVLNEQKEFLKTSQRTHNHNLEYSIDFTLTLNGAPAGRYVVEYVIHDMSSGESATVGKTIEIAG